MDSNKIATFFTGWDETLIWSCLQGCMGYAVADDDAAPSAAQIVIGDFCFFAGQPNEALIRRAAAPILVPRDAAWERAIERVWGTRVKRHLRYAIKKESDVFDAGKLEKFAAAPDPAYTLELFDRELYRQSLGEAWSKDLCAQFVDYDDFSGRGLGVGVVCRGRLVAGASSYTVYRGGIEIEIDTKPRFRRRGLATACGARLIMECLKRGLYPSWDAHDLRSVALAEKLGYHVDRPYPVYIKEEEPPSTR